MFRIVRGVVRDFPLNSNIHREGWWWHATGSPEGDDYGYSPEGPFISKVHARRHLHNTLRLHRIAHRTGRWPAMPDNAGWCPGWGGRTGKPTMRPLPRTRFFGQKLRNYIRENER
jgi:hypothetical protein